MVANRTIIINVTTDLIYRICRIYKIDEYQSGQQNPRATRVVVEVIVIVIGRWE